MVSSGLVRFEDASCSLQANSPLCSYIKRHDSKADWTPENPSTWPLDCHFCIVSSGLVKTHQETVIWSGEDTFPVMMGHLELEDFSMRPGQTIPTRTRCQLLEHRAIGMRKISQKPDMDDCGESERLQRKTTRPQVLRSQDYGLRRLFGGIWCSCDTFFWDTPSSGSYVFSLPVIQSRTFRLECVIFDNELSFRHLSILSVVRRDRPRKVKRSIRW